MGEAGASGWVRPRVDRDGLRRDALLALALALGTTTTSLLYQRTGIYTEVAPVWVWVLGLALCTLPLALRRRYPVPVAVAVSIGFFVCGQFAVPEVLMINICLFIALYTVGAWESNRALAVWTQIVIAIVMVAWLVISLLIASSDPELMPAFSRVGLFSAFATFAVIQIITNLLYFAGAFFFGANAWRAARTLALLEAQGRELESERQTSAEQAVALERLAIARELHDVVAHHVSVMSIQAGAARVSAERDPAAATAALELVERSAETTIRELRSLVGTLRTPEAGDAASTVGVARLPALVEESQRAGTPTTLIVAGAPRPLPLLVDVALYRVAQEGLTNVRKHAGRGATAEVRLRFGEDRVELEVADSGIRRTAASAPAFPSAAAPSSTSRGGGLGIRGMRERIGAVGGTLDVGRRERGGFMLRATVMNAPAGATDRAAGAPREGVPA
ncbi:sensor histidine kinase [Leucobacter weissii]|uniref:histidine kinase n=1 Tax=Leucobacter weissii TaxID=1983706 RepID=A0A939MJ73_9MICO|nr:histidine kinase [Leucobacter weissii]MBO1901235.1 sensor histidine kinase [Leucobacter weissii]